jgi:hypothetical protein
VLAVVLTQRPPPETPVGCNTRDQVPPAPLAPFSLPPVAGKGGRRLPAVLSARRAFGRQNRSPHPKKPKRRPRQREIAKKIAKKAVDGLSNSSNLKSFSTAKPNLEADVPDRDPKTKFLSHWFELLAEKWRKVDENR